MTIAARSLPLITLAASLALAGCGSARTAPSPERPPLSRGPGATEGRQCLTTLNHSGARFVALADRTYGEGCWAYNSVQLDRVSGDQGSLAVGNLGPLTCSAANRFAGWARYGVDRAARQILGSPIARIETMGSYSCRNVGGSSRRSAHARAEAIDIGAFVLADGRRITVRGGWAGTTQEREFLRVIHRSACKRFGTVLGPDYNAAHADHLHLEQGDGSFCR